MSLLLDALKKAADDKQKVSQRESSDEEVAASEVDAASSAASITSDTPQSVEIADENKPLSTQSGQQDTALAAATSDASEELTLDDLGADTEAADTGENNQEIPELSLDDIQPETAGDIGRDERDIATVEVSSADISAQDGSAESTSDNERASSYTITDDALSMLIYKTNANVRKNNRLLISGVLLMSILVLVAGGFYYYLDMQAEIADLERKHQIAMQSMRSKTSGDKAPEKSEIIRNLVSDADLDEKVEYAKKHMSSSTASSSASSSRSAASESAAKKASAVSARSEGAGTLSIQRTDKTDPVGDTLESAWLAYEAGRYDEAKRLYSDVLLIERNNRDARLGLAAIAVIEKDTQTARQIYQSLLKLDPRDPIATAAITSLRSDESAVKQDENYLLSMIEKNPKDPHLNSALGNVYAQQGRWKLAQQQYFNAWQQDTENADYIFNLAVSMDQLSKPQQAVSFYRDSLEKANDKQVSFSREAVQKRIVELSGL